MENSWHPIFLAASVGFFSHVARFAIAWVKYRPGLKRAMQHQKYILPVTVFSSIFWILFGILFVMSARPGYKAAVTEMIGAFKVYMFFLLLFIILDHFNLLYTRPKRK